MRQPSVRRVGALVALLVVLSGAFLEASSSPQTPVQASLARRYQIHDRLHELRVRRHHLLDKIRRIGGTLGHVSKRGGKLRLSSQAETAGTHMVLVNANTRRRLRHVRRQLHRRYAALVQRRGELNAWFATIGVFRRCPVLGWTSRSDNFGVTVRIPDVPVHLHHGIDIMAPAGSPIVAPFDGFAHSGVGVLGGNTVIVRGPIGWVYNAHLSTFSVHSNGPVKAGDVIGYVGATGDATAPHDHFEFHPNSVPAGWPASPFGYSSIGSAIDPSLPLDAACG